MQITPTKTEDLKRGFTVKLTPEEFDAKMNEKLTAIAQDAKMPGFRPGKAPLNLVKSKYGKAVMGEVLEAAVNDSTLKVINENKLRPAMRPKIEVTTFGEKEGLEYHMEIELLPEIKVADLSGIRIEKLVAKPGDKTVTETLERIAKSNRASKKVEENRAAKTGDLLLIDFDGTVDGKPFPGMKAEGFELELGSKSFIDTFEDQLTGSRAGDEKTVNVTFPKDYGKAELQGVKAVFKVKIHELREGVAPQLDDEFAKKLGFESIAKVKEVVTSQIQNEYDQVARMNVKRVLLDILDEKHDFAVPAGMVEAEFEGIWRQVKGHAHHGDDPNHVHGPDCAHEHGTPEEREEFEGIAERRVKLGLVLAEIGRENKIDVTNEELQHAVIAEARRYPGKEREVFEYYQKNPHAIEAVKAPIYEDKVIDFILARAEVKEKEVSIDDLTKAAEKEPEKKPAPSKKKAKK